MLILLSPAKAFHKSATMQALEGACKDTRSAPRQKNDTLDLYSSVMAHIQTHKDTELRSVMHLSQSLNDLNVERYRSWSFPSKTSKRCYPAMLYFAGDVYQGLGAHELNSAELEWANKHVRILSGLHGLLRPMDVIAPYRLEMSSTLKNNKGENLYDFWNAKMAKTVKSDIRKAGGILLNLASSEYFRSVDPKALDGSQVCSARFYSETKRGWAQVSYTVKRARGYMTRWVIDNKIMNPEELINFNLAGYHFDDELSELDQGIYSFKLRG